MYIAQILKKLGVTCSDMREHRYKRMVFMPFFNMQNIFCLQVELGFKRSAHDPVRRILLLRSSNASSPAANAQVAEFWCYALEELLIQLCIPALYFVKWRIHKQHSWHWNPSSKLIFSLNFTDLPLYVAELLQLNMSFGQKFAFLAVKSELSLNRPPISALYIVNEVGKPILSRIATQTWVIKENKDSLLNVIFSDQQR